MTPRDVPPLDSKARKLRVGVIFGGRSGGPAAVLAVPVALVPRAAFAASSGTITLARVPDGP